MKITLESTSHIVSMNGVQARVWEGRTDSGIPVHCYVIRLAVAGEHDQSQFQRELQQHKPPSPEVAEIPLRLII